ncbi:DNA modification methylase [Ignavibacterium album JCM 16511]|uniref:Methyltransferase n=1 Tax=Ignavibacterium album (strain DSM 19864 / JCM 16511 / NBRC 101810 / Mat9-16) TaxID=945713 RepID=I0AMX5_IGNAJ|nr:site-specific DNA-methyltransferase [Ignavibacterium album]AFH50332.1 DNA modification methylase [Ignavibacterium album JCM 16511]
MPKKRIKYLIPEEQNPLHLIRDSNLKYCKEYLKEKNVYLFQGDVLKSNLFRKEFSDLIITSPPYNVDIKYNSHKDDISYDEYLEFSEKWIYNCFNWSKPQGRFALNCPLDKNKGGQQSVGADLTSIAKRVGWKYHSTIIWNEGNISRRTAWGSWLSASAPFVIAPVELIIIFYKDQWKKTSGSKVSDITRDEFIEWTNGLWSFNGESKKRIGHPAPFPKELPRRLVKLFSFVGDIIFDPFVGSGTTIIEAVNNNRVGVGLDIDPNYCEIAKRRIKNESIVFNPKLELKEQLYA